MQQIQNNIGQFRDEFGFLKDYIDTAITEDEKKVLNETITSMKKALQEIESKIKQTAKSNS